MGETKKVQPLEGALNFLSVLPEMLQGAKRKDVFRDELNGEISVDTCCAFDTRRWETGILREHVEGKWIIVEEYDSRAEAETGHQKWVELMKTRPDAKLEDIDQWGLKSLE